MTDKDVIVIGAGFAGIRTLHTMLGLGLDVVVLETGDDAGGVWYWNRYPGARCDIQSYDYSYGFSSELEQEWRWTEQYATQPELLSYMAHVIERFGLREYIRFGTTMASADWNESTARWTVTTESGDTVIGRYLIMATGQLSTAKLPSLDGLDDFTGEVYHTGSWPHTPVDFSGKRVGIIGTGSSGVQLIPIVAEESEHLTVFQRTPTFTVPASNGPVSDAEDAEVKANYAERRALVRRSPSGLGFIPNRQSALDVSEPERTALYEAKYPSAGFGFVLSYYDLLLNQRANDTAADFLRAKIAHKVHDPATAELLTPHDYPFGAKRPSVDSQYYETFNRENVELIDIRSTPLTAVTAVGIDTTDREFEFDIIVFATGFDALTGSLLKPRITGRNGLTLREKWAAGPRTLLGLGTSGFPNFFVIAGPGSPSVLANVLLGIEQHVDWLATMLQNSEKVGPVTIEAELDAEDRWVEHVNERAAETLYLKAASWYLGANVPGKPRVFMPYSGGFRGYDRILGDVAADDYRGFSIQSAPSTTSAHQSKEIR